MELNCPHCGKDISEVLKQQASKGGNTTLKKYGKDHFKKIAKGWPKGKKRKVEAPKKEKGE